MFELFYLHLVSIPRACWHLLLLLYIPSMLNKDGSHYRKFYSKPWNASFWQERPQIRRTWKSWLFGRRELKVLCSAVHLVAGSIAFTVSPLPSSPSRRWKRRLHCKSSARQPIPSLEAPPSLETGVKFSQFLIKMQNLVFDETVYVLLNSEIWSCKV